MDRYQIKRILTGLSVWALILSSFFSSAQADDEVSLVSYQELERTYMSPPTDVSMAVDVLIARPLLLAASVVGTGLFVVSLPLSALGGNVQDAANKLVVTPVKATFFRCLGCDMLDDE